MYRALSCIFVFFVVKNLPKSQSLVFFSEMCYSYIIKTNLSKKVWFHEAFPKRACKG